MANFSPSNRATRFIGALAAGLLGVAAAAPSPRGAQKIVLDAVPVSIDTRTNTAVLRDVVITQGDMRIEAAVANVKGGLDFENGEWTVSGNVRIKAEGGSLRSDKAVVSFNNNLISRAVITGEPAEFEQQRKDGSISRGHASTISYEPGSGTVSLRQNAWLTYGCNELKGEQLVYNIKTQSVGGQPKAATGAGGRITITIQPKGESGSPTPCAKPGTEKSP
jgi:lipopolysaccharide transport protein LptA